MHHKKYGAYIVLTCKIKARQLNTNFLTMLTEQGPNLTRNYYFY